MWLRLWCCTVVRPHPLLDMAMLSTSPLHLWQEFSIVLGELGLLLWLKIHPARREDNSGSSGGIFVVTGGRRWEKG